MDRQFIFNTNKGGEIVKHFALIVSMIFLLAFVACGQGEKTEKATSSEPQKATTEMVQKKAEETTEMAKEKAEETTEMAKEKAEETDEMAKKKAKEAAEMGQKQAQ
jgi:hypothetical protein